MNFRRVVFTVLSVVASASLLPAGDVSRYREFHLGMPLADAAKQAGMESSEARSISSRPERLTDKDMTEALSAVYGPDSTPVMKEMTFNSGYSNTARVIAQWNDDGSLLSLVGFAYGGGYGVIVSSESNLALARQAVAESERLDRLEAPQKALDLQAKQVADAEARDEKSRLLNKPGFRP